MNDKNAEKKPTTPVPKRPDYESEDRNQPSPLPTPGLGEDDDIYDDTGGAV
jgi:hypothetical protein